MYDYMYEIRQISREPSIIHKRRNRHQAAITSKEA